MKTTHIRLYLLMMVCSLKTITTFAQPVIKVPPMCEVVVAGTGLGASTGFGGTVGNGGIVVMPDPFDFPESEGNFYYSSNDYELIQWELLGDLSLQTETSYNEALQHIAAINPVNIQSYNKKLRLGEMPSASQPNFDGRWARSKGRVVVTYYDKRCLGKIKFDVYKRYKNDKEKNLVPPILGSDCVLPNTTYTFSVDPIASDNPTDEIGFDSYYWSGLPEGCTLLYNSPDNSSITIKTGENVPSFTLQCCYGRANDWDGESSPSSHTTCVSKLIISTSLNPEYIVAPPTCHPTGTGSFSIVYPNTTYGTYLWSTSNLSWQITSVVGSSITTVTVTTPDNNNGRLDLTIISACNTTVTIPYHVNRNLTGATLITPFPTSPGSICMTAGTSNNQFFLGTLANANNVTWTVTSVPAAAASSIALSSVFGQPNSTVVLAIAANAPVNATYTLRATANTSPFPACNATSATYVFNVRPLTPTITPASGSSFCVNKGALTAQTYTCTASAGASYVWSFPAGWTATSFTTTTNSITVTPASSSAVLNGNAFVTATGVGTCNSPQSAASAINYNPVTPNLTTPTAANCLIVGGTTASVGITNAQIFGTYNVTSNPAGITSSGVITSGNLSLTIPPTLTAGTYSITVNHVAPPCGIASSTPLSITVGTNPAGWAAGYPSYDPTAGGSDAFRVNSQPLSTTYAWYTGTAPFTTISALTPIPFPGTNPNVSFSPSGNIMTLYGATQLTNPQVYCVVTPPSGCPSIINAARGTHGTARQSNMDVKNEVVTIYPNPNSGNFTIELEDVKQAASGILTDMNGKQLAIYLLQKGENTFQNEGLAKGTYILSINIDGVTQAKKIVIK